MSRICKSLDKNEQGYPHREHRSKRGRTENHIFKKRHKLKIMRKLNRGRRKGKWIA